MTSPVFNLRVRVGAATFPSVKRSKTPHLPVTRAMLDPAALRLAAKHTVDTYVRSGMTIGLGAGQVSVAAIQYLGHQLRSGSIKDITGIPTSVSSATEAAVAGIPLEQYRDKLQIDFAFDDADAMEEDSLISVIGRRKLEGGESIIQEKSILCAAKKLVFVLNENQFSNNLDGSVPCLIEPDNWMEIAEEIDDLFLGDAEVWRRPAIGHAGPSGGDFPLTTKEGHYILDLIFTSPIKSLGAVAENLTKIDGVVEHGILSNVTCDAVIMSNTGLRIVNNLPTKAV